MSTFRDLAKKNRSYRRFDSLYVIDESTLRGFIENARYGASMKNQQALKFVISTDKGKNEKIFSCLTWAAALKDWKGPDKGERPAGYVLILGDKNISDNFCPDYGIAAQNILLSAVEIGLGGCMLGVINRTRLTKELCIPEKYDVLLVVALGKPKEHVIIEDIDEHEKRTYFRDNKSNHHVPKVRLEDLILKL